MSVHKAKGTIPEGAVRLTEQEAINRQWQLIMNWTPEKDVWPFRYGIGLLSVTSAFCGIYINNHYRTKLHLHEFGRFSSYLPIVALPTVLSALIHQQEVSNDIIIERTACPVCVQMRSASLQVLISTVLPAILAPLSGFMFATRHYTYNLPPITKPLEHLKLWQKLTRPIGNILFLMCACQAFFALGLAHCEEKSMQKIRIKLLRIEKETLP
ncbi:hypothetical protein R5R35_005707 [Gryllus longicercus]|uniref:Uncharacterized protein n=1 Tax=Gryllus longicercus TaxID=2509291 RepID=A0AAN9WCZ6_9ORTH